MTAFEEKVVEFTKRGSNKVPGVVMLGVNREGKIIVDKTAGYNGSAPDAPELDSNATFWIASCTKLIGTIAVLQTVEDGLIGLDDPVEGILPELASLEVVSGDGDTVPLTTSPKKGTITLRHLLSHTSGVGYDFFPPLLAWRQSRGEGPLAFNGCISKAFAIPLRFEPGLGWAYGGGLDWAGELVARLHKTTLEEYLQSRIFGPLGMSSTTFRIEKHPEIKERLMKMSERVEGGILKEAKSPWPEYAEEDNAGAGLYTSASDYIKVLADLITNKPKLLQVETISKMLEPQFTRESSQTAALLSAGPTWRPMTGLRVGDGNEEPPVGQGLGGILTLGDMGTMRKGTLLWGGLPNLVWFLNREEGAAGFYATQFLPMADETNADLVDVFVQEVWRINDQS